MNELDARLRGHDEAMNEPKETLIKSKFVIPAKAGIHENQ
jgi:hypothetical protein